MFLHLNNKDKGVIDIADALSNNNAINELSHTNDIGAPERRPSTLLITSPTQGLSAFTWVITILEKKGGNISEMH